MMLRRPTERLAGCVWLPRFLDKCRHHLAGTLDPDFRLPFCNPLATDGAFLAHFRLEKESFLEVVARSSDDDQPVVAWFQSRPEYAADHVATWNDLAPNLGKEGFPLRRGFLWILKRYYGGVAPDPRVDSVFTAIAYDEGFLDEM